MQSFRQFLAATLLFFLSFAALYGGFSLTLGRPETGMVLLAALLAAGLAAWVGIYLVPATTSSPDTVSDEQPPLPVQPAGERQMKHMVELEKRLRDLKMLRQFSEALNFTINFDAMLWLVYTHSQDILNGRDFYIYLIDTDTGRLYTAFCVENGERQPEKEGLHAPVTEHRIRQVIEIGLIHEHQADDGRYWLTAPLNAGADTVGALRASHSKIDQPFPPFKFDLFGRLAYTAAAAFDHWMTNESLQARADQLESLIGVIHSLNAVQGVEPLLEMILEQAVHLTGVEAGSCLLLDEKTGELVFRVVRGPYSEKIVGTRLPFGKGIAGKVAQTAEPLIVNDVEQSSLWFAGIDNQSEFRTESILTVPLTSQQEVLGVLQLVNRQNGLPFTNNDRTLLTAFAGEAAMALVNARLLAQTDAALQERVRELSLLREIDRQINHHLDTDRTMQSALNWIQRLYRATAANIVLFDPEGRPVAHRWYGYDEPFEADSVWSRETYPGLVGQVLRSREPLVCGDITRVADYYPAAAATRSQMTIPIMQDQQIIGAIAIESDQVGAYGPAELESAVGLVNHMTAALANSLLYLRVQAANQAKSEFVSVVSHELKTPLTSIRGYTGLMKSGLAGEISDKQKEFLTTIENNVTRMGTLIQDLTDVARLDTGHLFVKFEPIPIANVVNETVTSIRSLIDEKEIKLQLDLLPHHTMVMADHARLVQVMTNLVSNACKYSPPQSEVCVSLSNGGNFVRCAVRDTGYGIAPEDQQKLFSKFFRSSDPNIRQESGTGLGLSITKGLVELHGGQIGFDSVVGQGTTFWFTVPVTSGRPA